MTARKTSASRSLSTALNAIEGVIHTVRGERVIAPSLPNGHPLRSPSTSLQGHA